MHSRLMPSSRVVALLVALLALPLLDCRELSGWFLIAGQSNAVGASSQLTVPSPGIVFRAGPGDAWAPIADPHVHGARGDHRGSPWPAFARHRAGVEGLIATATGGSCLLDWAGDPRRSGRWDPETGTLYQRARRVWLEIGSPELSAVLWLQGECDAQGAWNAGLSYEDAHAAYLAALLDLGDAVSRDFGAPLVAAPVSLRQCLWQSPDCASAPEPPSAKTLPIHDATLDAIAGHSGIVPGPVSDDLRMMPDGSHVWDVEELGRRWAEALGAAGL